MKLKTLPALIMFCCHLLIVATVESEHLPGKITVATEEWEPGYTKSDGSGLYEDILRNIYPGIEIEFIYTDYMRSKALVKKQSVNMWLGAYLKEESYALFPKTPKDFDEVFAFYLNNNPAQTPPQFKDAQMAWLVGYKYDKYFPSKGLQGVEVRDIATAVRLLRNHKVQFILGDETEILEGLQELDIPDKEFSKVSFGNLGLYPGFSDTSENRRLLKIWDTQLNEMLTNGKLLELFKKHQLENRYLFN